MFRQESDSGPSTDLGAALVTLEAMAKRMKARSYPEGDTKVSPQPVLTGIAKAAQELSVAVEDFDRQAASWSRQGDLVRT